LDSDYDRSRAKGNKEMKIKRKGKLALFIIGILSLVVAIPHVFADHEIANSLPVSDESGSNNDDDYDNEYSEESDNECNGRKNT
jgi:hypothetical protein